MKTTTRPDLEKRFKTPARTLWIDRMMNHFIKVGGIGIILAVLGIFVFILSQVLPLFQGAQVAYWKKFVLPAANYQVLGMDEWGEQPFLTDLSGRILFVPTEDSENPRAIPIPWSEAAPQLTAVAYHSETQTLVFGTSQGSFSLVQILYQPEFSGKVRKINSELQAGEFYSFSDQDHEVQQIEMGSTEEATIIAALLKDPSGPKIKVAWLEREETLLESGQLKIQGEWDLPNSQNGPIKKIRLNETGNILLTVDPQGNIDYYQVSRSGLIHRQRFQPFADRSPATVSSMDFLLGGVSVYLTNPQGDNRVFSLYRPKGQEERLFGQIKEFPSLNGPAQFFQKSLRNKGFLAGSGTSVSLRHSTTEKIRWQEEFPRPLKLGALSKKYHRIALLNDQNQLTLFNLEDPHPESSWQTYFGKIWYEGGTEPEYAWQSTGGSDSFEPKLSLIPLIIGTLKGTFYALLFAVPLALLGAIYTSQFLEPKLRQVIKPTMEIMASLPSVILGFLAALWLAPLIEDAVPSLMLIILLIPSSALLFGFLFNRLPVRWRAKLPEGREWLFFLPFLMLVSWIGWELGPYLEKLFFVATDPSTGTRVADFRLWWPQVTGTPFEQRNSLVVGFIMGFAVIPIIFTISEESLSAVPKTLRSASLALGASRWQTAIKIILPAAASGIFSAIMIGFGRAVGETMIVLMATGNTPIMDFNIFSGMRTLSANLAVELPEAPFQGTLYRSLFLGSLVLFLMTFGINSLAEMLRQRIRNKVKV